MECAKCGEYFIGTCVSLKCYDILYNEKKDLEQENAKLKRDKKDQCIMYDDLHKKYTKVLERMTKAEAKLHNIEEGLKRLEAILSNGEIYYNDEEEIYDGPYQFVADSFDPRVYIEAPTLAELIDKILTGGE